MPPTREGLLVVVSSRVHFFLTTPAEMSFRNPFCRQSTYSCTGATTARIFFRADATSSPSKMVTMKMDSASDTGAVVAPREPSAPFSPQQRLNLTKDTSTASSTASPSNHAPLMGVFSMSNGQTPNTAALNNATADDRGKNFNFSTIHVKVRIEGD